MTDRKKTYVVVHLIAGTEYKVPLLNSQIFGRASVLGNQDINKGAPTKVEVWAIVSFRVLFSVSDWKAIRAIRKEHSTIRFRIIAGIDRYNKWPAFLFIKLLRNISWGKYRVIYHCRGASAFHFGLRAKNEFRKDKVVYDVRGADPLEALAKYGIFETQNLDKKYSTVYESAKRKFYNELIKSDWIFTVSEPLKIYICSFHNFVNLPVVVPCCVPRIIDDSYREKTRNKFNLSNKIGILYLGGTQKYQYLEDLVLPFLAALCSVSERVMPIIFTHDKMAMQELINISALKDRNYILESVQQKEVAEIISAADIGLMVRAPSEMNAVAQPVKFAEYLASGLGIVVQHGTGIIPEIVERERVGLAIDLYVDGNSFEIESKRVLSWFEENANQLHQRTQKLVETNYTWQANVYKEINSYIQLIN